MIEIFLKALAYSDGIALAAAGITLIYMATGTFNFAHASKVAWGFYITYAFLSLLGGSPYYYFLPAALFSAFLGFATYIFVNRYLLKRKADMVTLMMSTLGVDLVFFAFLNVFADYLTETFKLSARYFVLELKDPVLFRIGGAEIKAIPIVSFILVVLISIGIYLFMTRTNFGIAMRTTIENPELAQVLGINPEKIYLAAWLLGGGLAGLAGAFLSLTISGYPSVGMTILVTLFAGSIVGGLDSVLASILGGFLIGLVEELGTYSLSVTLGGWICAYRPVIPMIAMVITLLFYPRGLAAINWKGVLGKIGIKI